MADRKRTVACRCATYLLGLIETGKARGRVASPADNEAREDALSWLAQFDDRLLVDTLHQLYKLAERSAAEERKRSAGRRPRLSRLNRRITP